MGNYVTVSTMKTDPMTMRPKDPGAINGGFFTASKEKSVASVVIAVDNIEDHVKKVVAAGGTVIDKPVKIPMVGWYVSFIDTEGNIASLLEPEM